MRTRAGSFHARYHRAQPLRAATLVAATEVSSRMIVVLWYQAICVLETKRGGIPMRGGGNQA
ncbi:hypothetical protein BZG00_11690 [Salinivibrio kushneri]|uniref:Uncharacterized protein n=1 Tax=Salinivibrio kushneri TaxID=1908198 RepID=A0AB36JXG7_9GAMM|nr:hypothetical protein BZG00_11690 [Salinivibrio kushneri]